LTKTLLKCEIINLYYREVFSEFGFKLLLKYYLHKQYDTLAVVIMNTVAFWDVAPSIQQTACFCLPTLLHFAEARKRDHNFH